MIEFTIKKYSLQVPQTPPFPEATTLSLVSFQKYPICKHIGVSVCAHTQEFTFQRLLFL